MSLGPWRARPAAQQLRQSRAIAASAGESRNASSSRHQSVARRPPERQRSSSAPSDPQGLTSRPRHARTVAREHLGDERGRTRCSVAVEIPASPIVLRSGRVDGAGKGRRRRLRTVDDHGQIELAQAVGAHSLLGFAMLGVRNENRPGAAAHHVEHGVVSRLRDGDRRARQKRRKIRARALDDHAMTRAARQMDELVIRRRWPRPAPAMERC